MPAGERERRSMKTPTGLPIEIRAAAAGAESPGTLVGYAAVFDSESEDLGGFREIIRRGAFTRSLRTGDPVALVGHDSKLILGRRSAGTVTITEDEKGLRYEVKLPNTSVGRDIAESVKRGDVTGSSFGFSMPPDRSGQKWSKHPDGKGLLRELTDVLELYDVGPVTFPAYPATSVGARSIVEVYREGEEIVKAAAPAPAKAPARDAAERRNRLLRLLVDCGAAGV